MEWFVAAWLPEHDLSPFAREYDWLRGIPFCLLKPFPHKAYIYDHPWGGWEIYSAATGDCIGSEKTIAEALKSASDAVDIYYMLRDGNLKPNALRLAENMEEWKQHNLNPEAAMEARGGLFCHSI